MFSHRIIVNAASLHTPSHSGLLDYVRVLGRQLTEEIDLLKELDKLSKFKKWKKLAQIPEIQYKTGISFHHQNNLFCNPFIITFICS